jgi:hypothetical protein
MCRRIKTSWLLVTLVVVTIVMFGSSSPPHFYSSVSAFSFQSAIHHHNKIFDKKQGSDSMGDHTGSSGRSSDAKRSDKSNNEGNSNNDNNRNNNQGTNDGSNPGADNNLQPADTDQQQQQQQQGGGENVAPIDTSIPTPTRTPTPQTACEQGSNCTDQQVLSDRDRSSTTSSAGTSGQDNNTPFVLPFP